MARNQEMPECTCDSQSQTDIL